MQSLLDFGETPGQLGSVDPYVNAVGLLSRLKAGQPGQDQEFVLDAKFVKELTTLDFFTRFLFYIVLRAELRYQGGYERRSLTFEQAVTKTLGDMVAQIAQLIDVKDAANGRLAACDGDFLSYEDMYSTAVVPAMLSKSFEELVRSISTEVVVADACQIEPNSMDVIVCDPPYGAQGTPATHLP
jgi:hypothetical protein